MGTHNQQKSKLVRRTDGSESLFTGVFIRTIPPPKQPDPPTTEAEIAQMKKLLAARKKHPADPKAAMQAYRESLSPEKLAEIDSEAQSHIAAMKEWARKYNEQPREAFARARAKCKKVLSDYEIEFDQLPDFTWADGTRSIDPDPRELGMPEIVRDAVRALMEMHGLPEELATLRAFAAGMAFQRMLVRPFERHVFDAKQRVEAMNSAREKHGLVKKADKRQEALARVDELIAAGSKVEAAVAKVAKESQVGISTIYTWRRASRRGTPTRKK